MTYCLALRLDEGIVFLSDTRTNAGLDNISSYRKTHIFTPAPDRVFVLQSAGSLATTHQVLDRITADLGHSGDHDSLATVDHFFDAARYVGRLNREVGDEHRDALTRAGSSPNATFILGGQIKGERPDLVLVHSEGNYIRASDDRPFLQIGESKYGKFMLEFAARANVDLNSATKVALGSMLSTARANLSVGPPYDVTVYRNDCFELEEFRFDAASPLLVELEAMWARVLLNSLNELPSMTLAQYEEANSSGFTGFPDELPPEP